MPTASLGHDNKNALSSLQIVRLLLQHPQPSTFQKRTPLSLSPLHTRQRSHHVHVLARRAWVRSLVWDYHLIDHQDTVLAQGGDGVGQQRQRLLIWIIVQDVAHVVHTRALVRLRIPKVKGLALHAGDGDGVGQEEGLLLEDDSAGQGGVYLLEQRALLPDAAANIDEQGRRAVVVVAPRGRRRRRRRLFVGVRWQVKHVEEGLLAVMKLAHPEAEFAQEPGVIAGPDECRLVRRHGHLEGRVDDVVGIFVSCVLEELGSDEIAAGANLETGRGSISTAREAFQGK